MVKIQRQSVGTAVKSLLGLVTSSEILNYHLILKKSYFHRI